MACLRTQGWLPKHPWLKNKNWGAVVGPQLWDNVPAHWNVEPWRGPYTLDDRLPTPSRETSAVRLWGSDCPSPVQPPAHYPLLHLPSAQHTYGYPPPPGVHPGRHTDLVMPFPSGHHQSIHFTVLHRGVPQPPSTCLSPALLHIQTQTCSYAYIYCL